MEHGRDIGFWIVIGIGAVLVVLLLVGQTYALIDYDHAVSIGLQESVKEIGGPGIAFAKGFAFGDTVLYLPLLILGIVGLLKRTPWGFFAMFAALAITAYWPIVNLYAMLPETSGGALALLPEKLFLFKLLLPLITLYALWGMWYLYSHSEGLAD